MLTASLAIGVSGISGSAPGGVAAPSGDSGAQRVVARVAGAVQGSGADSWTHALAGNKVRQTAPVQHLRRAVSERRTATWAWQSKLGYPHTRTAYRERQSASVRYLRWLRALWTERADSMWRKWVSLRDPREAICHVFGLYCTEALAVARCESGWAYSVNATNGQYLGLFQMGSYARSAYGHGSTAIEQARAAYRYFVASGRTWGPWSCKP